MTKKFFDILPPSMAAKEDIPPDNPRAKEKSVLKKKNKGVFLKGLLSLIVLFVVVVVFGFFLFPSAEIEIKPEKSSMKFSDELTMDFNAENPDISGKVIPVRLFEKEKTIEKEFSSTGKTTAEKKASGTITVYNEYSENSRTLVPSRFVSADGKLFWSKEKITIPGYKKEGGKIVPGQKEVRVEANESGEGYNIGPTTFALPALAGSQLYTTIYAKSFSPMTGGAIGEISQVTENDLASAKSITIEEAKNSAREDLINSLSEGYIIMEQNISYEILEEESSLQKGSLSDSFKFKVKVKSSGFAFKKEDMDKFIDKIIADNLNKGEKVLQNSLSVDYSFNSANASSGVIPVKVSISGEAYKDINISDVKNALLGKSVEEAKILLGSLTEVSEFKIKSKPFLRKSIPDNPADVEIILIIN